MSKKYLQFTNQLAKEFAAKILSHIQSKIESVVIEDVSEFLAVNPNEEKKTKDRISNELKVSKQEVFKLKQDFSRLIERTDFMLGSVAYFLEEYDDLKKEKKVLQKLNKIV